jgi:hypothetical protein
VYPLKYDTLIHESNPSFPQKKIDKSNKEKKEIIDIGYFNHIHVTDK